MSPAQLALAVAIEIAAPALGNKRYLCDVRQQLGFERRAFEELVLSAWRDGFIELSRADLVRDVDKEAASEIRYLTETFHYAAPCAG